MTAAAGRPQPGMTKATGSAKQQRILVADDSEVDRLLTQTALLEAGFSVELAENGAQALELFRQPYPDMVLLDVIMPELDGFETCARLRASPAGAHTPIIIMTSLEDIESINKAYDLGATDFIVKPVNPALLAFRVRYALRATATAEQLRQSQQRLSAAQRTAKLGYWQWDAEHDVLEWSEEISRIFGLEARPQYTDFENFLGRIHNDDRELVERTIQQARRKRKNRSYRVEHRVRRDDGTSNDSRHVNQEGEWRGQCLHGILQDITELRRAEQRIRQLAYYDGVTGLPNRAHLRENLHDTLARAKRYKQTVAVLFLDLDRFKEVNDSLGHSAGDRLLKQVAARLVECVRSHDAVIRAAEPEPAAPRPAAPRPAASQSATPDSKEDGGDGTNGDTVVRLGGDEFVIVAGEINRRDDAAILCQRIIATLTKPFTLDGHRIEVTASIGVSLYPQHGDNLDTLLARADSAMYRAKQDGRNGYRFFSAGDQPQRRSSDRS